MPVEDGPESVSSVWDRAGVVVPPDELAAFLPHLRGMQAACRRLREVEVVGDDIGVDFDPAVEW